MNSSRNDAQQVDGNSVALRSDPSSAIDARVTQMVIRPRGRALTFPFVVLAFDLLFGLLAVALTGSGLLGLALIAMGILAQAHGGAYRERLSLRALDTLPAALRSLALAGLTVLTASAILPIGSPTMAGEGRLLLAVVLWAALLPLARTLSYRIVRSLRVSGRHARATLIAGCCTGSMELAKTLQEQPAYGLRPLGFVGPEPMAMPEELPYLGRTAALAELILLDGIESVVIDARALTPDTVLSIVEVCDRLDVEILVVPTVSELLDSHAVERVQTLALFRLPRRPFRSVQWKFKRLLDIAVSGLALVLLSPVIAVAAFAVSRETGAGWLFRQRRVGLDGQSFDVLKLQTMVPATKDESQTQWNIANDNRLGPVGRFLRQTSIDELPQLVNVLRGEMSLVGPRPERPHFVQQFGAEYPRYMARHRVPCGLTGFAQVEGLRGDTSIAERVAFDNLYIEQWSLWLDLKIMLRTVPAVIRGEGG